MTVLWPTFLVPHTYYGALGLPVKEVKDEMLSVLLVGATSPAIVGLRSGPTDEGCASARLIPHFFFFNVLLQLLGLC